ncbi:hypothetical protein [Pseudomonas fluorescens]|uniref:hypothetical protein n=1 Tax=Pseudomonas fluorescens TaxID=294 RepID=UPI001242AC84|nr:hypothetical protein [Pseudomonas fluorescens]
MVTLICDLREAPDLAEQLRALALYAGNFRPSVSQLRAQCISLAGSLVIHLHQSENFVPSLAQLQVQLRNFVLVEQDLMPAGFYWRWASEPIVGVFYIKGDHGNALLNAGCIYSN